MDLIENAGSITTHHQETGGNEGRRKMIPGGTRNFAGFGVSAIHSEYGMTELLSQPIL
jgi:hypothetical protein